jgi:biotin carboxyl carrier protein
MTAPPGRVAFRQGERVLEAAIERSASEIEVTIAGDAYRFLKGARPGSDRDRSEVSGRLQKGKVVAPMPGKLLKLFVSEGDLVSAHQPLMALESMKIEHVVAAPYPGRVEAIACHEGDSVGQDQQLLVIGEE